MCIRDSWLTLVWVSGVWAIIDLQGDCHELVNSDGKMQVFSARYWIISEAESVKHVNRVMTPLKT